MITLHFDSISSQTKNHSVVFSEIFTVKDSPRLPTNYLLNYLPITPVKPCSQSICSVLLSGTVYTNAQHRAFCLFAAFRVLHARIVIVVRNNGLLKGVRLTRPD